MGRCFSVSGPMEMGTWWARKQSSTGLPSTSLGPVQPLGERNTIMGQRGRVLSPVVAGVLLDALDLPDGPVQGGSHLLVHLLRLTALHKAGFPAAAAEELLHLLMGDPGEDGGVGDLEAVQVQDGQHRAVSDGVQEFVGVPRCGQGAGLRLTIAHHAGGDEIRVIRHSAEGVGQRVAQARRPR